MDLLLRGKIAIIGGASKGIGFGIAYALGQEGCRLVITARREADLAKAAEKIQHDTGADVLSVAADVRKAEDCERVVQEAAARFGGIDVLVNNDGAPPLGEIESFDDIAWHKAVEQNLMSVIRMVRGVTPHMKMRGSGSILNIAAISAIQPIPGFALSVATWSGVIGYAKTLSLELGPHNINVNTICPGYIDTTRLQKVFAAGSEPPEQVREKLCREIALGRIGTVDDIASIVALLVSPRGAYITGTTLQVDGGLLRAVR